MLHTLYIPCTPNKSDQADKLYDILNMDCSNEVFFSPQTPIIISNDEEAKGTIIEYIVYKNSLKELCQQLQHNDICYSYRKGFITITRSPKYETIIVPHTADVPNKRLNNHSHYLQLFCGKEANIFETFLNSMSSKKDKNTIVFNQLYINFYEIDEANYDHYNQLLVNVELDTFQVCKSFLNNSHITYIEGALFNKGALTIDDLFGIHCMVEVKV